MNHINLIINMKNKKTTQEEAPLVMGGDPMIFSAIVVTVSIMGGFILILSQLIINIIK